MHYETIEKHFTAPIRISSYYDNVKIPRKLKKKVKNFCGIHYKLLTNSQRLWYYLDKANPNYKRFLIKLITKSNIMIKLSRKEQNKILYNTILWIKTYYYPLYKTAIIAEEVHLYYVVTRTNYITATLWLQWRKQIIKNNENKFISLPDKPNWLVLNRQFRQEESKRLYNFIKTQKL